MKIEDTNYKITDGLWSLITKKIPTGYTEADYNTYKDIVRQTEVTKYPSNTTKKVDLTVRENIKIYSVK